MQRTSAMALIALALVLASGTSQAQDLHKDSFWNGAVTGAGVGAAAGLVVAGTTEEFCSVAACTALLATAGSAIGLLIDKRTGDARPVEPGQAVDDPLSNGALIGAVVTSGIALLDFVRVCRSPNGCTTAGVLSAAWRGALYGAVVGILVDAAIPSRAAATSRGEPAAESRRFSVAFGVRF